MSAREIFENNDCVFFRYKGIKCRFLKTHDGRAIFSNIGAAMENTYEITDDAIVFRDCKPHMFRDMTDIKAVA